MTVPSYAPNPIVAGTSNADVLRGILEELKSIFNGGVDDTNLAAGAVTADKLAGYSITTAKLAALVIDATKGSAGCARGAKIDRWSQTQVIPAGGSMNFDHNKGSLFMCVSIMYAQTFGPTAGSGVWGEHIAGGNRITVHNTDVQAHTIKVVVF